MTAPISKTELDGVLRRFPELPTHFIYRLMKRESVNYALRTLLKNRTDQGHLIRYKPLIDPDNKISKHYSYALNEAGNRDTTIRAHRLLESMMKASVQIGVMENPDFEYIGWDKYILSPNTPRHVLDLVDSGVNPHSIPISKDKHLKPDGAPFTIYHTPTDTHINVLDEIDRKTEPLTTTKDRRNIEEKFEHYHEFLKNKLYKSHYGFRNCFVRFLSIQEARTQAMMRLWEKKYGAQKNILFQTVVDEYTATKYSSADGRMFTMPYRRVGYPDFFLNTFWKQ